MCISPESPNRNPFPCLLDSQEPCKWERILVIVKRLPTLWICSLVHVSENSPRKIITIHGNRKFVCFVFLFMETFQSLFGNKRWPNVFVNMKITYAQIKGKFVSTCLSRIISISRSIDSRNSLLILFSILKYFGIIENSWRTLTKTCYVVLAIFYQFIRIHIRKLSARMIFYRNCCNLVTSSFLSARLLKSCSHGINKKQEKSSWEAQKTLLKFGSED